MTERRETDDDDQGVARRGEVPPLSNGPNTDWGRSLVSEVRQMRGKLDSTAVLVAKRHDENIDRWKLTDDRVSALAVTVNDHVVTDETALIELKLGLSENTTVCKEVKGLVRVMVAFRGAAEVARGVRSFLIGLSGLVIALAALFGVLLWVTGKAPMPAIHFGG